MAAPKLRRTRIVCISDTHNCTVHLPPGDVLIHAGDLTNQGSYSELRKTVQWLEAADFEAKIIVAGNHDITLDADFYFHHGQNFHRDDSDDAKEHTAADCLALLTSSPSITYLCHDSATIRLKSPTGPHTEFSVFGSPYSPRHGLWAFYYDAPPASDRPPGDADGDAHANANANSNSNSNSNAHPHPHPNDDEEEDDEDLTALWELIPLESDIVVTHTPPRTHLDDPPSSPEPRRQGCEALRQALWRVRPRLAVCGHIHRRRGAERVRWDLRNQDVRFAEASVAAWQDPGQGSNKQSLVDLTGRRGDDAALDNDGLDPSRRSADDDGGGGGHEDGDEDGDEDEDDLACGLTAAPDAARCGVGYGVGGGRAGDVEALRGRMGRRETCIVNAAIMKKSHPHVGGKELNKPIVVDVDLPVWED